MKFTSICSQISCWRYLGFKARIYRMWVHLKRDLVQYIGQDIQIWTSVVSRLLLTAVVNRAAVSAGNLRY
jgi:hypothetical protein